MLQKWTASDSRFKYYSQSNKGQGAARNMALSLVDTDYFTFIDADDIVDENYLKELYEGIISSSADIFVTGFKSYFCGRKVNSYAMSDRVIKNQADILKAFLKGSLGFGPTGKLYKTVLYKDFRFNEEIIYEDLEYLSRLYFATNNIACSSYIGYLVTIRSDSTSHKQFSKRNYDLVRIVEGVEDLYMNSCYTLDYEIQSLKLMAYLTIVNKLFDSGCVKDEKYFYNSAVNWISMNIHSILHNPSINKLHKLYSIMLLDRTKIAPRVVYKLKSLRKY